MMSLPEIVEIWIRSLQGIFEAGGVEVIYKRSPPERPNPSFALTLRQSTREADLLVWESGHADLTLMDADGLVNQEHFENLETSDDLAGVLARVAAVMQISSTVTRGNSGSG